MFYILVKLVTHTKSAIEEVIGCKNIGNMGSSLCAG